MQAQQLGLAGWVRNLPDGRVEVLAAGGDQDLERFEQWLGMGPPASSVTEVDSGAAEATPDELPEPFEVRF
jgi:acylphosphatase